MRKRDDIEFYLLRSGLAHQAVDDKDMWLVRDAATTERIVVSMHGPLVVFRVKILELAQVKRRAELFAELLRLNANDMVTGSYGLVGDAVVLTCTARLENLDYNEFQGTLDDFSLAFANHFDTLSAFREAA